MRSSIRTAVAGSCIVRILVCGLLLACNTGCSSLLFKIQGTPARELPDSLRPASRNNRVPIDYRLLGQVPPDVYRIDSGDVLGIAVEGILPFSPPTAPPPSLPVNFPSDSSTLPPSTGFPIAVQQDGTIQIPGVSPILVRGLTVEQIRTKITEVCRKEEILKSDRSFPIVTVIRPRTYNVSVIRQDLGAGNATVQLEAYRNDVLNALLKTGGLPGENAKDQVTILRNSYLVNPMRPPRQGVVDPIDENQAIPLPEPAVNAYMTTIPMKQYAGEYVGIPIGEAILQEGDILYIENRSSEVFYTSGLLPAGQHPIPRDYDIDIFEAMSIAGYSYGKSGNSGGGGMGGLMGITGVAPTELFIFRKKPDGCEIAIKIDLKRAICDPRERLIVQAGDKLLLRYAPREEVANFSIFAIFTFGIQQLFRGN